MDGASDIDGTDLEIVDLLVRDGRRSLAEIGLEAFTELR